MGEWNNVIIKKNKSSSFSKISKFMYMYLIFLILFFICFRYFITNEKDSLTVPKPDQIHFYNHPLPLPTSEENFEKETFSSLTSTLEVLSQENKQSSGAAKSEHINLAEVFSAGNKIGSGNSQEESSSASQSNENLVKVSGDQAEDKKNSTEDHTSNSEAVKSENIKLAEIFGSDKEKEKGISSSLKGLEVKLPADDENDNKIHNENVTANSENGKPEHIDLTEVFSDNINSLAQSNTEEKSNAILNNEESATSPSKVDNISKGGSQFLSNIDNTVASKINLTLNGVLYHHGKILEPLDKSAALSRNNEEVFKVSPTTNKHLHSESSWDSSKGKELLQKILQQHYKSTISPNQSFNDAGKFHSTDHQMVFEDTKKLMKIENKLLNVDTGKINNGEKDEFDNEVSNLSKELHESLKNSSLDKVISSTVNSHSSKIYREFRESWFRERKARVDWMQVAAPCEGLTEWESTKPGWGRNNRTFAGASFISYQDIRPAGQYSRIFIQSKTNDGRAKVIGGDFWRVKLRGPSVIAATVFDHNNGSYEALFLIIEPGLYRAEIILDYTLCDGLKDPPDDWFKWGNAQGHSQEDNILGTLDEYLNQPLQDSTAVHIDIKKPLEQFSFIDQLANDPSCAEQCNFLRDGFGRWLNRHQWKPFIEDSFHWDSKETMFKGNILWSFGDSISKRFSESISNRLLCRHVFKSCIRTYNWIYPLHSNENDQAEKKRVDNLDFNPGKVLNSIKDTLSMINTEDSMLLLNLGLHFPMSIKFSAYKQLIDDVVKLITKQDKTKDGKLVNRYKTNTIWRTTTAICKELSTRKAAAEWRFFSYQRVVLFNAYATWAMCRAGIKVLDVFPLTASYPEKPYDVVHFSDDVYHSIEEFLETYSAAGFKTNNVQKNKDILRTCIMNHEHI